MPTPIPIIEIEGVRYVDARWIENEYTLSRCMCRRKLLAGRLDYHYWFKRFFYQLTDVERLFALPE